MTAPDGFTRMKILIVDDEPANVSLLQYILTAAGYQELRCVTDSRQAMGIFREFQPDLILLDLMMPFISGFEIMAQLRRIVPPDDVLPILVLTADVNMESKHQALLAGASDFLTKPFDQIEVLLRIRHLLQLRTQHLQLARQNDILEDTVRERTGELRQTLAQLEETLHQLRSTQQQVIQHERLSALGAMAAGLAHDFNNSLSLILGYSELLLSELAHTPYQEKSDEFLGTVITAAQDAAKMFGRLRSILPAGRPRPGMAARGPQRARRAGGGVDASALARAGARAGGDHHVAHRADAGAARVAGRRGGVARDAHQPDLQRGGRSAPGRGDHPAHTLRKAARWPWRSATRARAWTRKRAAAAWSHSLRPRVRRARAWVWRWSTARCSATAGASTCRAPRAKGRLLPSCCHSSRQPAADAPADISVAEFRRPWRILVVDDQPVFVNILRHYLAHDLHTVETAYDGREALVKFRARAFDLVITDQAMPHMHGEELAAAIKAISPHTRVILLTGYSGEDARTPTPSLDAVILKPVTHAALRAIINRTMAGYQPAPPIKRIARSRRRASALRKLELPRQPGR